MQEPNALHPVARQLHGFAEIARQPPPAHILAAWNPPDCGDIGLKITADGTWWHQDAPFTRPALVQLFASILRREDDGRYFLVTPHEKIQIAVADLPFVIVDLRAVGTGTEARISAVTNLGAVVDIGPDHAIVARAANDMMVHVRANLWARVGRNAMNDLAQCVAIIDDRLCLTSLGRHFDLGPAEPEGASHHGQ